MRDRRSPARSRGKLRVADADEHRRTLSSVVDDRSRQPRPARGLPAAGRPGGSRDGRSRRPVRRAPAPVVAAWRRGAARDARRHRGEAQAILLLAAQDEAVDDLGDDAGAVAAYSLIWGWRFAVGFVLLLFVHEMGHVIAAPPRGREGLAPRCSSRSSARSSGRESLGGNALAEARVGLAGRFSAASAPRPACPIASATGNDLCTALAFTGFFLNLFNLLPVVPLDGGRAMAAMSPWMWFLGLAALAALTFAFPNPIVLIIAVVGGLEVFGRWKRLRGGDAATREYYVVRPRDRALVALVYLGLIAAARGRHGRHPPAARDPTVAGRRARSRGQAIRRAWGRRRPTPVGRAPARRASGRSRAVRRRRSPERQRLRMIPASHAATT